MLIMMERERGFERTQVWRCKKLAGCVVDLMTAAGWILFGGVVNSTHQGFELSQDLVEADGGKNGSRVISRRLIGLKTFKSSRLALVTFVALLATGPGRPSLS